MSWRNFGNVPLFSTTAATASNPSTATLVAELITSTETKVSAEIYEVRWAVAGSSAAIWLLEQCISSGLGSSAITQQIAVMTGANLTSEFVYTHRVTPGDRFRIRCASTFSGTACGTIQAEPLT